MIQPDTSKTTKFSHPDITAKGEVRASVTFGGFKTLWFNTGTLCNITCPNCYIESSPTNDLLAYLTPEDMARVLGDLASLQSDTVEIGFTGGEPFLNPSILTLIELALSAGHAVLVLTNAMRPMMRPKVQAGLQALHRRFPGQMTLRVSLDHWSAALHDRERGPGGFDETCAGIDWLVAQTIPIAIAGRTCWGETEAESREGFARLIARCRWPINAADHGQLVLFPEMDKRVDVPEITTACWDILKLDPAGLMCASSRMVVKHRGQAGIDVRSCTLLPYEDGFSMGAQLVDAMGPVKLNHPHCAKFCVLGGGSCSA
jgi:uncharacterized Fe-S cluster-containing radical SAM superfamily protein